VGVEVIPQIPASRFTWEKCGIREGVSQLDIVTEDFNNLKPGVVAVGWCEAIKLPVRPRHEGAAILVENPYTDSEFEQAEIWIHVPDWFAEAHCAGFKKQA
jgi:hypothetical protein